jgi:hypothetical protein
MQCNEVAPSVHPYGNYMSLSVFRLIRRMASRTSFMPNITTCGRVNTSAQHTIHNDLGSLCLVYNRSVVSCSRNNGQQSLRVCAIYVLNSSRSRLVVFWLCKEPNLLRRSKIIFISSCYPPSEADKTHTSTRTRNHWVDRRTLLNSS